MLVCIDTSKRVEFVSSLDSTEPKTVFVLRPLTSSEMVNLSGHIKGGRIMATGDYMSALVRKAVVEIKNPDISGEGVTEYLDTVPPQVLIELSTKIDELVSLTEQDQKN